MKSQKHESTMLKSGFNCVCLHHRTFKLSPSWYRCFIISTFHHRIIDFSLSYFRVFSIEILCSHHRTIVIWKYDAVQGGYKNPRKNNVNHEIPLSFLNTRAFSHYMSLAELFICGEYHKNKCVHSRDITHPNIIQP